MNNSKIINRIKKLYRTFSLGTPLSSLNCQCYLSIPYSKHPYLSEKSIAMYRFSGGAQRAYLAHGLSWILVSLVYVFVCRLSILTRWIYKYFFHLKMSAMWRPFHRGPDVLTLARHEFNQNLRSWFQWKHILVPIVLWLLIALITP